MSEERIQRAREFRQDYYASSELLFSDGTLDLDRIDEMLAAYADAQSAGPPSEYLDEIVAAIMDVQPDPRWFSKDDRDCVDKIVAFIKSSAGPQAESELCHKPTKYHLIAGASSYACMLTKDHEGECQPGGECFVHGLYVGSTQCPKCVEGAGPQKRILEPGDRQSRAAGSAAPAMPKKCPECGGKLTLHPDEPNPLLRRVCNQRGCTWKPEAL